MNKKSYIGRGTKLLHNKYIYNNQSIWYLPINSKDANWEKYKIFTNYLSTEGEKKIGCHKILR